MQLTNGTQSESEILSKINFWLKAFKENLGIEGKIRSKCILKNYVVRV
jgi:hypothetical protein